MPTSQPPDHRDHLRWVRENRATVFGEGPTVREAIRFLDGFDSATGYSLMRDLQTWLVVTFGGQRNVHWHWLLTRAAFELDGQEDVEGRDTLPDDEAVDRVLELVLQHLDDIERLDRRTALYRDRSSPPS